MFPHGSLVPLFIVLIAFASVFLFFRRKRSLKARAAVEPGVMITKFMADFPTLKENCPHADDDASRKILIVGPSRAAARSFDASYFYPVRQPAPQESEHPALPAAKAFPRDARLLYYTPGSRNKRLRSGIVYADQGSRVVLRVGRNLDVFVTRSKRAHVFSLA